MAAGVGGTLKKHTANGFDRQRGSPIRRVTVPNFRPWRVVGVFFHVTHEGKWARMITEAQMRWGWKELEKKEGK